MSIHVETSLPDLSTSAAIRKIRKPLIERKRRERINSSMDQLKALVLQSLEKNEDEFAKMEKADILEMAVEFLKSVPLYSELLRRREQPRSPAQGTVYGRCAEETRLYLAAQPRPLLAQQAYANLQQLARPVARVGGYPCSQATPSPPPSDSGPVKPAGDIPSPDSVRPTFADIDPSLTKPLTIVVPSYNKAATATVWRPW